MWNDISETAISSRRPTKTTRGAFGLACTVPHCQMAEGIFLQDLLCTAIHTQNYLHTDILAYLYTAYVHIYVTFIPAVYLYYACRSVSQGKFIKGKFITILSWITLCIASMFLRETEHSSFASQSSAQTLHDIYALERQKLTQAAIISFEANCKSCHFSPLHKLFSPDKHY